jgi:hypothetical protein
LRNNYLPDFSMNDEQEKKTFEKYLPDFSSRAVNMEDASKQLKEALDKIAQAFGHDPKSEVYSSDYRDHGGRWDGTLVGYEACPLYDWGVSYSLGAFPKSYNPMKNPNDWYLECHYGFDVVFTAA